ncbi:MAG: GNAT family N-acetyltransferase [Lachnospiraceae bacterium]
MKIRFAEKRDIPQMHRLLEQVCMVHHKGRPDLFVAGGRKYEDEELEALLNEKNRPILVAVDEKDCACGYAFCVLQDLRGQHASTDIKTLYIDDLCVDETKRTGGIGHQLYDAVVAYARELGCYNVTLNVWSCNPTAMRFYESCGMKPQKIGMEYIL